MIPTTVVVTTIVITIRRIIIICSIIRIQSTTGTSITVGRSTGTIRVMNFDMIVRLDVNVDDASNSSCCDGSTKTNS